MDFLCSTGAPWPAAQCTETQSAEVCIETEGREEGQDECNTTLAARNVFSYCTCSSLLATVIMLYIFDSSLDCLL